MPPACTRAVHRAVGRATAGCAARRRAGRATLAASSRSSAASASDVAIGFSTRTCLPASSAARASGPCSFMLVSTSTRSTSAAPITASGPRSSGVDVERAAAARRFVGVDVVHGALTCDAALGRAAARSASVGPGRRRCRSRARRCRGSRCAPRAVCVVRVGPAPAGRRRGRRSGRARAASAAAAGSVVIAREPRSASSPPGRASPSHRARRTELLGLVEQRIVAGGRGQAQRERPRRERVTSPRSRPRGSRRPRPERARPPSATAPPRARRPSRVRRRRRPQSPGRRADLVDPGTRPARSCVRARPAADRARRRGRSSAVTAAHTASAATTAPQNACVCVTARWLEHRLDERPGRRRARRASSRHSRSRPRTARGAPPSTASTTSRNSPEEDTASKASPGRHAKRTAGDEAARDGHELRALPGLQRGEPERRGDVVRGAVPGRDDPPDAVRADERGDLLDASSSVDRSVEGSSTTSRQSPVSSSTARSLSGEVCRQEGRTDHSAVGTEERADDRGSGGSRGYATRSWSARSTRSRKAGAVRAPPPRTTSAGSSALASVASTPPRAAAASSRAPACAGSATTSSARSTPAARARAGPLAASSTGGAPSTSASPCAPATGARRSRGRHSPRSPTTTWRNGDTPTPTPKRASASAAARTSDPTTRDGAPTAASTSSPRRRPCRRSQVARRGRRARRARSRPAAAPRRALRQVPRNRRGPPRRRVPDRSAPGAARERLRTRSRRRPRRSSSRPRRFRSRRPARLGPPLPSLYSLVSAAGAGPVAEEGM